MKPLVCLNAIKSRRRRDGSTQSRSGEKKWALIFTLPPPLTRACLSRYHRQFHDRVDLPDCQRRITRRQQQLNQTSRLRRGYGAAGRCPMSDVRRNPAPETFQFGGVRLRKPAVLLVSKGVLQTSQRRRDPDVRTAGLRRYKGIRNDICG